MDRIIPHISRLGRLSIQDISARMIEHIVASLRDASAPRLQHFDLSARLDHESFTLTRDHIFTGDATALTSARIVGLCHICTPPLVGLTTLHFGGACRTSGRIRLTHREFRDMLTASPSLANLALEALEIRSLLNTSIADVQLPSLRTLSLNFAYCEDSFVQILTLLSTPILETLNLAHMNKQHMLTFEISSGTGAPRYTTLQTLKLFICSSFREPSVKPPESFFFAFSSITHLYLISTANFILEPNSPHHAEQSHWPNLRAVTISPDVLPNVIRSRKARGHPITTAYVPHNCFASDKALWACIREEVEVLEVDNISDSLQYPGGLDQSVVEDSEEDEYGNEYIDDYDDDEYRSRRHTFYEQSFGVDYNDSDDSELLEYWAVCGSD
jgi:hypothetical protein